MTSRKARTDPQYYAVLTGDIIRSRRLTPGRLASVRAALVRAVKSIRGWQRGLVRADLEFFRGDAWQLLLTDPGRAVRAGVFLRASVLAQGYADTRVAIGLGAVDRITRNRVSLSTGEAFVLSGHAMDEMTQYTSMTIEIPSAAGSLAEWMPVVGHLCDSLIGQWTQRQAEIASIAADPKNPDHEEIARRLEPAVSKQAVSKALGGASWYSIREVIDAFENTQWDAALSLKKR